ncbi:MAG: redox-sensing transcriptional repressor Rex [Planctomycetes bacterium]|nr:redox-sensing transcriptional repressor Rex [Planctomycetota bacterium]
MSAQKNRSSDSESGNSVPKAVVNRLSLYLRELQHAVNSGHETTSSSQLGNLLGFSDAQVRKDLAYFGQFGYPGIGYRCDELIAAIRKILGTDRQWHIAVVGVGNLGRALLGYKGFLQQGFELVAAFDVDRDRVGTKIEGVEIFHLDQLTEIAKKKNIKLAMIAVPAAAAQQVADRIADAHLEGVVNFAPVTISLPDHISQVGVDLAIELEQLAFSALKRARR